jgi:hypothetical protein
MPRQVELAPAAAAAQGADDAPDPNRMHRAMVVGVAYRRIT